MRLSDSEWKVMQAVWEHQPCNARTVLEEVEEETGWAYSTVKTLLARLVEKGAVSTTMEGNTSIYEPRVSRDKARRSAVRSLLDRAFDGAVGPLVHHLVRDESLSSRDREALRRLLEKLESAPGSEPTAEE